MSTTPNDVVTDDTQIETRTRIFIADELGVEEDDVIPGAKLQDDFGADSLDMVELALRLEEEFEIEIPDEAVDKLHTVEDVVKCVQTRVERS